MRGALRKIRSRRLLIWVLAITGGTGLALVGGGAWLYSSAETDTVGVIAFREKLAIPPLAESRTDQRGRKVFDLDLQTGTSELKTGTITETWGANGTYLGPTLRASRGEEVMVNVDNGLPETTTLHWHGMHLPAAADGGPHQPIEPGATWSPTWTIDQPSATLWYHPHQMGETAQHVYRGVAGLFILDDDTEALPLPKEYGVDDIPLIVQDKSFRADGSLDTSPGPISPTGMLGEDIIVNGTYGPYFEVTDGRARFRLLNASNARVYNFGFSDDRAFDLIATDGGLLEAPQRVNRIQLSPGERAEIVAEFRPGEVVVLRSLEPKLGTEFFAERFAGGDDRFDVLQIRAAAQLDPSPALRDRLVERKPLDEQGALRTRHFELGGQGQINGSSMRMDRIDEIVERGTTEVWEVHNRAGIPHSFHIHDVRFEVREYAGKPPPPALTGLKDTVYVPPGESVHVLIHFSDYADAAYPYMFHCHILQHEDRGMMGQFLVVQPAEEVE